MEHEREVAAQCQQTIRMLHEVLEGEPLAAVSARTGLSRSAAERRVKSLAVQLTRTIGVEGLHADGAAFLKRLRLRREAILRALDHFDPAQGATPRSARCLSPDEVALGALRVRSRSSRPHHDLALYYLTFATGLRPLEVARLQIADYLDEDGSVRCESWLRAEAAINGKSRPLFFRHRRLDEALSAYLHERSMAGHGAGPSDAWRGLDPASPLFYGPDGTPYAITRNGKGNQRRYVCRGLLAIYRKMFRNAGIHGICVQSARLTLMSRMYERGADEEQVGVVLGIADRSAVREQMPRPRPPLPYLLEQLV